MIQKRVIPLLAIAVVSLILIFLYQSAYVHETWRQIPERVGMGEIVSDPSVKSDDTVKSPETNPTVYNPKPVYKKGKAKPNGEEYNVTLIVAKTVKEDISWMDKEVPEVKKIVYVADDPEAPFHPPKNKGHEVMIYLTFIIDHYDDLPDVSIFMHAHQHTWHNNDILDHDAAQMLRRLNPNRVYREGYMNVRCHWYPGCPDWMHPGETEVNVNRPEEVMIAKAWSEIFPMDPVPEVLAGSCCAQFALSRERIHAMPLGRYIYFRDWVLRTQLPDHISGRVWEYIWQYVFTGESSFCPAEHACYCDGYGVCFGGKTEYDAHMGLRGQINGKNYELNQWKEKVKAYEEAIAENRTEEAEQLEKAEPGKDKILEEELHKLRVKLEEEREQAIINGEDPEFRARELGRAYKEGDGF